MIIPEALRFGDVFFDLFVRRDVYTCPVIYDVKRISEGSSFTMYPVLSYR